MLKPDDDPVDTILRFFGNFVEQCGRMRSVTARNPIVLGAVEDTCEYLGIEVLEEGEGIARLDEILFDLRSQGFF